MLGSLILYLKGMRTIMFQLSGFYCTRPKPSLNKQEHTQECLDQGCWYSLALLAWGFAFLTRRDLEGP